MCWNYCHVSNLPNGYGSRSADCPGILWSSVQVRGPDFHVFTLIANFVSLLYFYRQKNLLANIGESSMPFLQSSGKKALGLCTEAGYLLL
jgi:hypothetical protein